MPQITTELLDRLTAQLNKPVALAYGRHLVAGNIVLRDDDTTNNVTILMVALGEGEWDSVEELRLNGLVLDASKFHFHPGKDGETGTRFLTNNNGLRTVTQKVLELKIRIFRPTHDQVHES